jgi:aminopeptidase-like protein
MKFNDYIDLLNDIYPLNRTLNSDDTDLALGKVAAFIEEVVGIKEEWIRVHGFRSGSEVSTWIIPKRYAVNGFYLLDKTKNEIILSSDSDHPLSLATYSDSVNEDFSWEELNNHLYFSEEMPDSIPFVYNLFYKEGFGFCLPKTKYDSLDRNSEYRVYVDTTLSDGLLKCLEVIIPGESEDSILMMSNICHPYQVNDSLTGVINNIAQIKYFSERKNKYTLRFGFWPEMIGAQAYFSLFYPNTDFFKYALFTEMLGTEEEINYQYSKQDTSYIDNVLHYCLSKRRKNHNSGLYLGLLRNDDRVSNGCNLNIPTISIFRWPFKEYHTDADNPSIINTERLGEAIKITTEILEILNDDKTLTPTFFGQPFLTRYGLFHDHGMGKEKKHLNRMQERIFSYSDGKTSLFEIAGRFEYDFKEVLNEANRMIEAGLLK